MTSSNIAKAELVEIKEFSSNADSLSGAVDSTRVKVQFNPQTLKVNLANQLAAGDQPGGTSTQYVGSSTSKLNVELLFDTTVPDPDDPNAGPDVRAKTEKVAYFVTATSQPDADNRRTPPKVRFQWGSFIFEGVVESFDESLEYFSEDGVPLRASVSLSMSRPSIVFMRGKLSGSSGGNTGATSPLDTARPGDSIASMAARIGASADWKGIASANGIDDPLRVQAGARVNLNVKASGSVKFG